MQSIAIAGVGPEPNPKPSDDHIRKSKKATFVAVLGTFIEYYDFSIYGYVAAVIAQLPHPRLRRW